MDLNPPGDVFYCVRTAQSPTGTTEKGISPWWESSSGTNFNFSEKWSRTSLMDYHTRGLITANCQAAPALAMVTSCSSGLDSAVKQDFH